MISSACIARASASSYQSTRLPRFRPSRTIQAFAQLPYFSSFFRRRHHYVMRSWVCQLDGHEYDSRRKKKERSGQNFSPIEWD